MRVNHVFISTTTRSFTEKLEVDIIHFGEIGNNRENFIPLEFQLRRPLEGSSSILQEEQHCFPSKSLRSLTATLYIYTFI